MQNDLFNQAMELRMILTRVATGEDTKEDGEEYKQLRGEFITKTFTKNLLPDFVISCRLLNDFWPYIKRSYNTYAERREFIREQFEPILVYLEKQKLTLHHSGITNTVEKLDCEAVQYLWDKAVSRITSDPEGAITVARSLLEAVCKQILYERNVCYEDSYDLPKLFKLTTQCLNLAPENHGEEVFKQILGGSLTTVYGFASLRNKFSDAHGQVKRYKVNKRHAELAVNLAGSMAAF
jgi:hypothetical protein